MSPTYKQEEKEKARRLAWIHAVRALTEDRTQSQVVGEGYVEATWLHCYDKVLLPLGIADEADRGVLDDWSSQSRQRYGDRSPDQLRIAYLAGPEPQNDLDVLLELGVRIENVWAIESEREYFEAGIETIRRLDRRLKVHHGTIEDFFELHPDRFDIIFLDFTRSMLNRKEARVVEAVFDGQKLADLGVLILNTTDPEPVEPSAALIASYFWPQDLVEGTLYGAQSEDGEAVHWMIEGPITMGYDPDPFKALCSSRLSEAYSAFATHYPIAYANMVSPYLRIATSAYARRQLLTPEDRADELWSEMSRLRAERGDEGGLRFIGGHLVLAPGDYFFWHFLEGIGNLPKPASTWHADFVRNERGTSKQAAIRFQSMLRSMLDTSPEVLSPTLLEAIGGILVALPDYPNTIFCDAALPNVWLDAMVFRVGQPYHANIDRLLRMSYTAKTRTMYTDVFVFDRCRNFYDWLPTPELYGRDLQNLERQMVSRACMDAICRAQGNVLLPVFSAANLICYGEVPWKRSVELPERDTVGKLIETHLP